MFQGVRSDLLDESRASLISTITLFSKWQHRIFWYFSIYSPHHTFKVRLPQLKWTLAARSSINRIDRFFSSILNNRIHSRVFIGIKFNSIGMCSLTSIFSKKSLLSLIYFCGHLLVDAAPSKNCVVYKSTAHECFDCKTGYHLNKGGCSRMPTLLFPM